MSPGDVVATCSVPRSAEPGCSVIETTSCIIPEPWSIPWNVFHPASPVATRARNMANRPARAPRFKDRTCRPVIVTGSSSSLAVSSHLCLMTAPFESSSQNERPCSPSNRGCKTPLSIKSRASPPGYGGFYSLGPVLRRLPWMYGRNRNGRNGSIQGEQWTYWERRVGKGTGATRGRWVLGTLGP